MKTFSTLATLALAGIAAAQVEYLSIMALRSASPIHFSQLTASDFRLFLGGKTASYCPEQVETLGGCPPGNTTTVAYYGGSLSMGAEVPGGQQVWIDSCTGEIGYTQAHSQNVPEDAIRDGWSVKQNALAGGVLGQITWRNGLIACPVNGTYGPYQVYAQVEDVEFDDDCLGFDAVFTNSSKPTAWQYT